MSQCPKDPFVQKPSHVRSCHWPPCVQAPLATLQACSNHSQWCVTLTSLLMLLTYQCSRQTKHIAEQIQQKTTVTCVPLLPRPLSKSSLTMIALVFSLSILLGRAYPTNNSHLRASAAAASPSNSSPSSSSASSSSLSSVKSVHLRECKKHNHKLSPLAVPSQPLHIELISSLLCHQFLTPHNKA